MPPDRDELIAYGPLLSGDGATWLGTAVLARARDPDAACAILTRTGTPSSRCTTGNSAGGHHDPWTPASVTPTTEDG
jgi:hypothetical protein